MFYGVLGVVLGLFWGSYAGILGCSRTVLGVFWGAIGVPWGVLGVPTI